MQLYFSQYGVDGVVGTETKLWVGVDNTKGAGQTMITEATIADSPEAADRIVLAAIIYYPV